MPSSQLLSCLIKNMAAQPPQHRRCCATCSAEACTQVVSDGYHRFEETGNVVAWESLVISVRSADCGTSNICPICVVNPKSYASYVGMYEFTPPLEANPQQSAGRTSTQMHAMACPASIASIKIALQPGSGTRAQHAAQYATAAWMSPSELSVAASRCSVRMQVHMLGGCLANVQLTQDVRKRASSIIEETTWFVATSVTAPL